ncbi:hypothetical protein ACWPOB_16375 [Rhodococcus sp. 2H158]
MFAVEDESGEPARRALGDRTIEVAVGEGRTCSPGMRPAVCVSIPATAISGSVTVTRGVPVRSMVRHSPRIALAAAMLPCIPAVWVNCG